MSDVRVMSWNIRTFDVGTLAPDLTNMANIIIHEDADIVCVQEIQIGYGVPNLIDAPISAPQQAVVAALHAALVANDGASGWLFAFSGANRGTPINGGMRDAYAFFYKATPQTAGRYPAIALNAGPGISPPAGQGWYPGRRPGWIQLNLTDPGAPATNTLIYIYSIHAATNQMAVPNAAQAIRYMPTLVGGQGPGFAGAAFPLPNIATLVVGDFNYDANALPAGGGPYANLMVNYSMGIPGNAGAPVGSTYALGNPPVGGPPVNKTANLYDNIFHLMPGSQGVPPAGSLVIAGTANPTVYDFISVMMPALVAGGLTNNAAFWALYKTQHGHGGVSDHLPVLLDIQF